MRAQPEVDQRMAEAEAAMLASGMALGDGDTLTLAEDEDGVLRAYVTFGIGGDVFELAC